MVCADLDADSHIDVFVTSHDPTVDVSHLVSESGDPIRQNKILFGDGRGGLFNTAGDAATTDLTDNGEHSSQYQNRPETSAVQSTRGDSLCDHAVVSSIEYSHTATVADFDHDVSMLLAGALAPLQLLMVSTCDGSGRC